MSKPASLTDEQMKSVGVIACQMVTGRLPTTPAQIAAATEMARVLDAQLRKRGMFIAKLESQS